MLESRLIATHLPRYNRQGTGQRRYVYVKLTSGEAFELTKALAPALGDDEARNLAALAGGSPFWIEALVRSGGVAEAGRLVTARLRGASMDAGTLVALLAVAGRPLAIADAAALNSWEAERTEQAGRELVVRGVAIESGAVIT